MVRSHEPTSYSVATISNILGSMPAVSRFAREILGAHRNYFGGRISFDTPDTRAVYTPNIGPAVAEPGLPETWIRFDEQYRSNARISRFWVAEVHNAVVFPPFGIVAVDNMLLRDTIRSWTQLERLFPDVTSVALQAAMAPGGLPISTSAPTPVHRLEGLSFLLGFGMYDNYFNWTLRYASRIGLYQAQTEAKRLLIPRLSKRYIADTLEFLGVPQQECHSIEGPVLCERLKIVSPVALGRYEISPLITDTLRGHSRVASLWRSEKKPLYIPRRNVAMRLVTNQTAVEAELTAHGFRIFDNAAHSVQEQVKAFRNASMIVAPHGAGLSNIVYCDPDTPVIELVPEGYDQGVTSYRSLSDLFGLSYTQLFAREVMPDRRGNRCNSDIEIDIAELVSTIDALRAHPVSSDSW
ncbi:DUF563 domain-containing protein [Falsiroseomonas sp.]|uniref:glycosyltransferase family 61 protein n=1 Tax=Falsiroseomonas sp. TaxID=2870721 RepID=UPI0034A29310